MGNTIVKENKKYRQGYVITETIVDGDIFKITEEYKDDKGEVVYIYEYYPTTGQLMKAQKEKEKDVPKNNKINKKGFKKRR
jgi:hypothetical protein